MTNPNFTTSILVNRTPAEVFDAINHVRGWWSEEIDGGTSQLNDEFAYHYQDVHRCRIKIVEVIPGKKIVWQVLDNYFSFVKDQSEWKGNRIVFEVVEKGEQTAVQFTQIGLVPANECYDICQNAWSTYIQKSLYNLITTGKGQPNSRENPQTADEQRLAAPDFTTSFFVAQSPTAVYNAINNVGGWWQGEVEGSTDLLGGEFTYRMKDLHFSRQQVVELVPGQKIVWLVTDSRLNFLQDKGEWTGTRLVFEISEINNKTQVRFTHQGLVPSIECYGTCTNAWSRLVQESLFSLITTGVGKEVF